jgi:predicted DCC family thiol-disulfide oxidoreductase YuxK
MTNGWTGGQYSLFRLVFGTYLAVHFAGLVPWGRELFSNAGMLPDAGASPLVGLFPNLLAVADAPAVVATMLVAATALAVAFAVGFHDRAAAVSLWWVWACLLGRNPLIANPGLPYVGWLLLAHACLPAAPYGSVAARGRLDPDGGWRFPPLLLAAAWIVMAIGYSYSGVTKLASPSWLDGSALRHVLENPLARPTALREWFLALPAPLLEIATWGALALELGFAPLALVRRLRPLVWGAMLAMHFGLMMLVDFVDLSMGMVMLHFLTFDPAWLPPRARTAPDVVFYDGHCGLCHGFVRFLLAEDHARGFVFAPLQGETFAASVPAATRAGLPDSIILRRAGGALFSRSAAVLHVLDRLGGAWRVLAWIARLVPRVVRDAVYDGIAAVRHRLFAAPPATCPLMPPDVRERFAA